MTDWPLMEKYRAVAANVGNAHGEVTIVQLRAMLDQALDKIAADELEIEWLSGEPVNVPRPEARISSVRIDELEAEYLNIGARQGGSCSNAEVSQLIYEVRRLRSALGARRNEIAIDERKHQETRDELDEMEREVARLRDENRGLARGRGEAQRDRDAAVKAAVRAEVERDEARRMHHKLSALLETMKAERDEARGEVERLTNLINTPHTVEFHESVQIEVAHQRDRWGDEHDERKSPADWLWALGYLANKAVHDVRGKRLHHIVASAALLANWYRIERERSWDHDGDGEISSNAELEHFADALHHTAMRVWKDEEE